jgi:hypothetical protein
LRGYKREFELVEEITEDLYDAILDSQPKGGPRFKSIASRTISIPDEEVHARFQFGQRLVAIKNYGIDNKSQSPQTPPQQ